MKLSHERIVLGAIALLVGAWFLYPWARTQWHRMRYPEYWESVQRKEAVAQIVARERLRWKGEIDPLLLQVPKGSEFDREIVEELKSIFQGRFPPIELSLDVALSADTFPGLSELNLIRLRLSPYLQKDTDLLLQSVSRWRNLGELQMFGSDLTDEGLEFLPGATALKRLNIGMTKVTDRGLKAIGRCDELEELGLQLCGRIRDEGLRHLQSLERLEKLDLRATRIRGEGLQYLYGLRHLRELQLAPAREEEARTLHPTPFVPVDADAVEAFRKACPECVVVRSN